MPVTQQSSRSIGEQSAILRRLGPLIHRRQARIAHPIEAHSRASLRLSDP
jgi:hypothetical protein